MSLSARTMFRLPVLLFSVLAAMAGVAAMPSTAGATALDQYLQGLLTLQTDFSQETHDASGRLVESGKGQMVVQRPGRFRWDYRPNGGTADGGQLLVADGKNLWFYERELAQVTVRDAREALSATPVVLLSGTRDEMRAAFNIERLPNRNGLELVAITPRNSTGDFTRAELGFRRQLMVNMEISDKLGQRIEMKFTRTQRNKVLAAELLSFKIPAGVDVIGKAR